MTTAVLKKGIYLVADKRSVGGHTGINDNVSKIFTHNGVICVFAGIKMVPGLIHGLIDRCLIVVNPAIEVGQSIYDFKDEIKKHAGPNFEGIVIANEGKDAFHISETSVAEIDETCTIGSGGDLAMGILLRDPAISPAMLYKLVSSKDAYTSEKYDIIDFTFLHKSVG